MSVPDIPPREIEGDPAIGIRALRAAALILGVLGIPSLIWQVSSAWPPGQLASYFFLGQAAVLYAFLSFGLGIGPMAARPAVGDEEPKGGDSAGA